MSNLWTFSPSSELYLHRCVDAAPPPDPNNKWFQRFGKKTELETTKKAATTEENITCEVKKDETISYEDFFDTLLSESVIPVEYVLEECTKNRELIKIMAVKLTPSSVEQLFKDIFSRDDVESRSLPFITSFLQTFLKQHNSRLCTDLITKTSEYPDLFKQLIEILLNDSETASHVLHSYVSALNEQSATNFMRTLSRIEITQNGFLENISSIYSTYKICTKDELTQNYIKAMIIRHSDICASDRNFGRLFLLCLQTDKTLGVTGDTKVLEDCLETHSSPFKRPCLNLLKEMNSAKN